MAIIWKMATKNVCCYTSFEKGLEGYRFCSQSLAVKIPVTLW